MTQSAIPAAEAEPNLSILVPVYNEAGTIRAVLDRVLAVPFPVAVEVIVVDDGSTDGGGDILRSLPQRPEVRVFFHEKNAGKGAAIQTALQHARGQFVVIQDADEELDPRDLLPIFQVVYSGEAAACYGSRFMGDNRAWRWRPAYWANYLLNVVCNAFNGLSLTDFNTCYKMMRTDVARRLGLVSRGFAMEPEITTKLARLGVRIIERPIHYRPREKAEGKKIRPLDFFRYLKALLYFRFAPMDTRPPAKLPDGPLDPSVRDGSGR